MHFLASAIKPIHKYIECSISIHSFIKVYLIVPWKDWWCWSWNSNTLATWCKELTHWKRLWCWERLKAGEEGDDRDWDCWRASPTQWAWVEQAPAVGDGQGSLACCSPWGQKESDSTEWLNWTDGLDSTWKNGSILAYFHKIEVRVTS